MGNFALTNLIHTSRFSAAFAVALLAATASAQTPPVTTATPCPSSTPPVVQSFSVENALAPNQILATMTPKLPAGVTPTTTGGTAPLEIRQFATFDNTNQLLTLNQFTVQTGAPLPTVAIAQGSIFSIASIKVDKVYASCTPLPGVLFVGTVATNSPASPFGNLTGAPAAVSVGLSSDNPPKITNVVTLVAGIVDAYAPAGGGTITFTTGSITPPGTGGGPTIIVVAPDLVTFQYVDLDASGTISQNPPLTFLWTVVAGAADIINPTSPKATAHILGFGAATYTFRVTVTDSKGNVDHRDVNVQFK